MARAGRRRDSFFRRAAASPGAGCSFILSWRAANGLSSFLIYSSTALTLPGLDLTMELNNDEIRRYSRHLILPEVGLGGQKKICSTTVLCIGAGGLGSPIAMYLAAAGIGKLGILDFDTVDFSNLQRQILHTDADVGRPKTQSAKETINGINPGVEVVIHNTRLTSENAFDIIK